MIVLLVALAVAEPSFVLVGGEPPCRPVTRQELATQGGQGVVWMWSEELPPLRRPAVWIDRPVDRQPVRLQVVLVQAPRDQREQLHLVAAPTRMWQEVPEALLPRWPLPESGTLSLPVWREEGWQVRIVGSNLASTWTPVAAGRTRVEVVARAASARELVVRGPAPARHARVRVYAGRWTSGSPPLLAVYEADEAGRLLLPAWPTGAEVLLLVEAEELAPAVVRVNDNPPAAVDLQRGCALTGTLVDENAQGVAGGVAVESWAAPDVPLPFQRGVATDAAGRFTVRGLPAGPAVLLAGGPQRGVVRRELTLGEAQADLGNVVVAAGRKLRVRVVDENGTPVVGARVKSGLAPFPTDGHGVAEVRGLAAGEGAALNVTAPGFLPAELALPPSEVEEATVTLRQGVVVRGRVVSAAGEPLPDARASLRTGCDAMRFSPVPVTAGAFEVTLEPDTSATLVVESPSSRQLEVKLSPSRAGEVLGLGDLVLPQDAVLSGRVVTAGELPPLPGARVRAPRPSPGGPLTALALGQSVETTAGADGDFRLAGLAAGTVHVRFEAEGRAPVVRRFEMPEQGEVEAGTVALATGATVRVRTKLPSEARAARVLVQPSALAGFSEPLHAALAESEAVLHHVPAGPGTVIVEVDDVEVCSKSVRVPPAGELRVDCPAHTTRVRGTVRVGGVSAGPGTLLFRRPGSDEMPEGVVQTRGQLGLSRSDPMFQQARPLSAAVNERGSFGPLELPPGQWQVTLHTAGGTAPSRQVQVPDAREAVLELAMSGTAVTGVVTDEEERPVRGAVVTAQPAAVSTVTGPDGRFALVGLPAGQLALAARHGERRSEPVVCDLREDRSSGPVQLRLLQPELSPLAITVRHSSGGPAAGATLLLDLGEASRFAVSDPAGHATVNLTAPFPARLRVVAFTGSALEVGAWTPWEAARKGVMLTLPEAAGVVVEPPPRALRVLREGEDLTLVLRLLGVLQPAPEGQPLLLWPLPPGNWTVAGEGCTRHVALRAGERASVSCP